MEYYLKTDKSRGKRYYALNYFPAFDEREERIFHQRSNKSMFLEWRQSNMFLNCGGGGGGGSIMHATALNRWEYDSY